jgi:hypothetical protein
VPSTQTIELHTRGRVRIDSSEVYTCWLRLYTSWRHLGVPFIDPRGLGAVGLHLEGNISILSGGAPDSPVHHRTSSGARFPSQNGAVDRCCLGAVGAPDTVRCTPNSSVPPYDRWLGHASRADCAADRWPSRPLAHRTVRCTPDSPVNYSRTSPDNSQERPFRRSSICTTGHCPVHHRTVRCARLS